MVRIACSVPSVLFLHMCVYKINSISFKICIIPSGGERSPDSPFPKPVVGAIIATKDGTILGRGRSSYDQDAVQDVMINAGIQVTPLSEWCVSWPSDKTLRGKLIESTLYITLEPSDERKGTSFPSITQLIQASGIQRVVIGCPNPIPEQNSKGAAVLHSTGIEVIMGVLKDECTLLILEYTHLVNSKLQKMARKHFAKFGRPLGFLHCSVVNSDDITAFARNGNAFGKDFGGKTELSFRDVRWPLFFSILHFEPRKSVLITFFLLSSLDLMSWHRRQNLFGPAAIICL
jgi:pyrimidine deaminase RibD-like protein